MKVTIKYSDNKDKSYGLSGAAIGLYVLDGETYMGEISINPDQSEPIELTPDFYFAGNPRISAKSVWNMMLENYHLTQAMAISNLLCRRIVNDRQEDIPQEEQKLLRESVYEEGESSLNLEKDEMERLFNKDYTYLRRIFTHPGVQNVASMLADAIEHRDRLHREEALEILSLLRRL